MGLIEGRAPEPVPADLPGPGWRLPCGALGTLSFVLAPVRLGERLIGLLAVDHGAGPHVYAVDEQALITAVARLAALVIEWERLLAEREEPRAAALALRESNRRTDEFLAAASHELRTPLTKLWRACRERKVSTPTGDTTIVPTGATMLPFRRVSTPLWKLALAPVARMEPGVMRRCRLPSHAS